MANETSEGDAQAVIALATADVSSSAAQTPNPQPSSAPEVTANTEPAMSPAPPPAPAQAPAAKTQPVTPAKPRKKKAKGQASASSPPPDANDVPTPASTAADTEPASDVKESPKARHDRLAAEVRQKLTKLFPGLYEQAWIGSEIDEVLARNALGSATSFQQCGLGKTRFPKWADNPNGQFQPSLAEMLVYHAVHDVLPHHPIDKFRCVTAEQHIPEKIDALLSDPTLNQKKVKDIHWSNVPFNVVNGVVNVAVPARSQTPPPREVPVVQAKPEAVDRATSPIVIPKRELPVEVALDSHIPSPKRRRTDEEETQACLTAFQEHATAAIEVGLEGLQSRLLEAAGQSETQLARIVQDGIAQMSTDLPSRLDTSLEIFANNLKVDMRAQIQEAVKSGFEEFDNVRETALTEMVKERIGKVEDVIRDEVRAVAAQDNQAQGFPVLCMPTVQMSSMGMGQMGQQMQFPGGTFIQPPPARNNMKTLREGQQQGRRS